ncbi:MAG TPA: hypothetical protein VIL34_10040 [Actinopolymorphaceae bacterium]
MELIVPVLVLVVGGLLWYFQWKAKQARMQEMQQLAARHGWTWTEVDDSYVRDGGKPFGVGKSRRARNVLRGTYRGREIVAYDYEYKTESGSGDNRSTQTHKYAIWMVRLPAALPELEVRPEGIFGGRVAAALGFGDLEVESEDFNRTYRVTCDDKRFGTAVIHPRMMELLLSAASREEPVSWRIEGELLVSWREDHATPAEIVARLDLLAAIVDLVPSFVWKDYGKAVSTG